VQAVTLDFYETLVRHRSGVGRGGSYREYLSAAGLTADPWEHQVLYDVFEYYGSAYSPTLAEDAKLSFWIEFTRRLFERTNARGPGVVNHAVHAPAIRDIMGSGCLALYEDALPVLRELKETGLRLGVISDWQKGLSHFCDELGIGEYLEVVVTSAEAGYQKPDARLFDAARRRLDVAAHEILHVGDRVEDVEGAEAAGFSAVLLDRKGTLPARQVRVIATLRELHSLI
jgi:putative hydrolase of the HAD superfamily